MTGAVTGIETQHIDAAGRIGGKIDVVRNAPLIIVRQTSLQSHPLGVQAIGLVRLIPSNRFGIDPCVSVDFQLVLRSCGARTVVKQKKVRPREKEAAAGAILQTIDW